MKLRTLQLLESREFWKWEDLVGVVVREARSVEDEEVEEERGEGRGLGKRGEGGEGKGKGEGIDGGGWDGEGREKDEGGEKVDIRIPEKAVTEAAKLVKGVLEKKVELEPEGKGFWD